MGKWDAVCEGSPSPFQNVAQNLCLGCAMGGMRNEIMPGRAETPDKRMEIWQED